MRPNRFALRLTLWCMALLCASTLAMGEGATDAEMSTPTFTYEETQYLNKHPTVRVCVLGGIAPIAGYQNGKITGITGGVLDEIALVTGFTFESAEVKDSSEGARLVQSGEIDMLAAIPDQYISGELASYPTSMPYLRSESILFINESASTGNLRNEVYANVLGGRLPASVNADTVKTYPSREQALNAVEAGEADYCYANEFSISYYTVKNDYKHIRTVPCAVDSRQYRMLYVNQDTVFLSIMAKALESVTESDMQRIILNTATQVERKLTLSAVINSCGGELLAGGVLLILMLLLLLIATFQSRMQSNKQIHRYMLLSEMSDEYIYEYDVVKDRLTLTAKCAELLGAPTVTDHYRKSRPSFGVLDGQEITEGDTREAQLADGKTYRIVNSHVLDKHGKMEYVIGKLIDVSEEKEKLHRLAIRAETDGLTGLYNAATTRAMIKTRCEERHDAAAALLIIDIDRFKNVNDTYGHPVGDRVLVNMAQALRDTFRGTDVVGRMGGDEFCVFMDGDVTKKTVSSRCDALRERLRGDVREGGAPQVTVSVGALICRSRATSFAEGYKLADEALYQAKENGRDRYHIVKRD